MHVSNNWTTDNERSAHVQQFSILGPRMRQDPNKTQNFTHGFETAYAGNGKLKTIDRLATVFWCCHCSCDANRWKTQSICPYFHRDKSQLVSQTHEKIQLDILAAIVKIENSIFGSVLLSCSRKIQNWHSIKNLETTKVQTCSWLKLVENQTRNEKQNSILG